MGDPIRLAIYQAAAVCAGVPAVLWALHFHWTRAVRRASFSTFALLGTNALELLLTPVLVVQLLLFDLCSGGVLHCSLTFGLFVGSRLFGMLLHQMVALEGTLNIIQSSHSRPTSCCKALKYALWIFVFCNMAALILLMLINDCFMLSLPYSQVFAVALIIAIVNSVLVCKVTFCRGVNAAGGSRCALIFLMVSIGSLIAVYGPCQTLICKAFMMSPNCHIRSVFGLIQHPNPWLHMALCVMSLRVFPDAVLCVLVTRETN